MATLGDWLEKCGLPHIHMLIFLEEGDKIHFVEQINAIISAQLPDPQIHPQLHISKTQKSPQCAIVRQSIVK